MKARILLIDDDQKLGELLGGYFKKNGHELSYFDRPKKGIAAIESENPDLIILDVMMPEMDGFEVCREIRKTSTLPIIMLTARGETTDRIVGLEIGADDYLPKPFEPRELLARIQSVLRRSSGSSHLKGELAFSSLKIDLEKRSVFLEGVEIDLTTMEYELLLMFAKHPGKKFSRDDIMTHLQGIEANVFSRSVDAVVSRLRQKLKEDTKTPKFIQTVWGTGYVFIGADP